MNILCLGTIIFAGAWREAGHRVCIVYDRGLPAHCDNRTMDFFGQPQDCAARVRSIVDEFKPDIVFQGDQSKPLIHCGIETMDLPRAWYAIDSHLHLSWHRHYAVNFNLVFCAQQNLVPALGMFQPSVEWLPLFCGRPAEFVSWKERMHDVSFVGSLDRSANPARAALFDSLRAAGISLHCATGDYAPVYRASRIVVNQSVHDDLNLRFFEAPGCGALLVTDRLSHSMSGILEEGRDFLAYGHGNATECAQKIRWALNHDAEAAAMARRAHGKITAGHSEKRRAAQALAAMTACLEKKEGIPDAAAAAAHSAWTHDYCSRLALPAPLAAYFAERGGQLAAAGRGSPTGRPLALLVLAGRALAGGNCLLARSLLSQIADLPHDKDARLRFHELKIETEILAGNLPGAREDLENALKEFPMDEELKKIEELLRRKL